MKKNIAALMALLSLAAVVSVGAQAKPADGFYFAEETAFQSSGWKDQVVLQVKGGKIVAAAWNGINNMGITDKKTEAAAGRYGMVKASKIAKEWHEQATAVEKYLIATQDSAFSKYSNAEGNTDAISGATMHVKGFFELVKSAISAGPVTKGTYKKDGWFYAKAPVFDKSGYKATALITIVNGRIVSANWNGINKDGGDSKFVRAVKGSYKMNAKQGEWNVQAPRVEATLVKQQDPAKINVKADGKTDAVSGVSVTINDFIAVATEALKDAK
ncbi:MAG: FMN-binding protein [Spirochaetae bacterium HGW-Spirochaetae-7]|jgi:major membrane immunogen (membrane-anchored lipoprotein)|nr:MAG: FMN-binding protein [Spirochaetae bacterium HGW-Spirochaetae-7]